MTMMPPGAKADGLNGGLVFRGSTQYANPEAAGLVNPAQEQLTTSLQQTQQGLEQNAATQAAQMAAGAKQAVQRMLLARNPDALMGLRKIAANPEAILGNTGLTLG